MDAYIKHGDLWKVLQILPFSSEVLHSPNYDDMFELVVVEVGRPEGHHQVPQTNQGAVVVCKEANHYMSVKDSHGCLIPILRRRVFSRLTSVPFLICPHESHIKAGLESVDKEMYKSHQYAILYASSWGPVEHASAVVLHLSLLKVKVFCLVVGNPNLKLLWLLTSVLRLVGWPGNGRVLDPSVVQRIYQAQG